MHEMAIATNLLERVLEAAGSSGMDRVESVELEVGALRQVVPEALELAFEAVAAGTPAEGAKLEIREVAPRARCRRCAEEFEPLLGDYRCPRCRLADVEIVEGREILLRTLAGEVEEEDERERDKDPESGRP